MNELLQASRLLILPRHAVTLANIAKREGKADSKVQGLSVEAPIVHPLGTIQSHAFGIALGRFMTQNQLQVVGVHASNTKRTTKTRELALGHIPGLVVAEPCQELWEHYKGDPAKGGLEGMLRNEAYPDEATRHAAKEDWDFRHGTAESGGETPREAGERWLGWFDRVIQQPDFRPRTDESLPIPTIVAFGHNLVTACGITLLNHDGENLLPPVSDQTYRVENGTALLFAEVDDQWSVLPERLVPTPAELEMAQVYAACPMALP